MRWGAIILIVMMFGPTLFPAVAWLWGVVGSTPVGLAISNGVYTVSSSIGLVQTYQQEVEAFYREHNPGKLGTVPALLRKYEGREKQMFAALGKKYGKKANFARCVPKKKDS